MVLFAKMCQAITGVVSGMSAVYLGYMSYHHGIGPHKDHNNQSNVPVIPNTITTTILPTVTTDICILNAGGFLDYRVTTVAFSSFFENMTSTKLSEDSKEISGDNDISNWLIHLSLQVERIINFGIVGLLLYRIIDVNFLLNLLLLLCGCRSIRPRQNGDFTAAISRGKTSKTVPRKRYDQRRSVRKSRKARLKAVSPTPASVGALDIEAQLKVLSENNERYGQLLEAFESGTIDQRNPHAQSDEYKAKITALEEELSVLRSQAEQMKFRYDQVQLKNSAHEKEKALFQSQLEDLQKNQPGNENLSKGKIEDAQLKEKASEQECKNIKDQLATLETEKKAREQECKRLKEQLVTSEAQKKVSEHEHGEMKTKQDETSKELDKTRKELKAVTQDLESSKSNAASLQDQFERMKTAKETIEKQQETFQIEAQTSKGRIEKLQESTDGCIAINKSLTDEINDLKKKIAEDAAAVAAAATVQDNEVKLKKEISVLSDKLDAFRSETITLKKDSCSKDEAHTLSMKEKDAQLEANKKEMDELRIREQDLESDLHKVREESIQFRKDTEDHQTQLKSQIESMQNQSQCKSVQAALKDNAKNAVAPNIDLKELEINLVKFDNKDLSERNKGLVDQILELKKENARLSKENASLVSGPKKEDLIVAAKDVEITTTPTDLSVLAAPKLVLEEKPFAEFVKDNTEEVKISPRPSTTEPAKKDSLSRSKHASAQWTSFAQIQTSPSSAQSSSALSGQKVAPVQADSKLQQAQPAAMKEKAASSSKVEASAERQSKESGVGKSSTATSAAAASAATEYDWRSDRSLTQDQKILLADGHSVEAILGADYLSKKEQAASGAATLASNPMIAPAPVSAPTSALISTSATPPGSAVTSTDTGGVVHGTSSRVSGATELKKSKWADESVSSSIPSSEVSSSNTSKYERGSRQSGFYGARRGRNRGQRP